MKTRNSGVLFGAVLAGFLTACTIMNNLHLPQQPPGDDDDALSDSSSGNVTRKDGSPVQADGAPACILRRPPAQPKPGPAGTDMSITVAMRNMASDPTGPRIGLDQDGICTCLNGAPEACKVKGGSKHCDVEGQGGLDNAASELFRSLAAGAVKINIIEEANFRVQNGQHGNVFRIDGYNGKADDDAVTVTFWPSSGVGAVDFTKVQTWPIAAPVPAKKAYVAQNQLVAQFDAIEVFFLDDINVPVFMNAATMTGEIKDGTLGTALFSGRVNTTALIQGMGQVAPAQFGGDFALCNSGTTFSGVASNACLQSDLPADPGKDKTGDADCNMLSMSLELRLVPAMVGGATTVTRPGNRCTNDPLPSCD